MRQQNKPGQEHKNCDANDPQRDRTEGQNQGQRQGQNPAQRQEQQGQPGQTGRQGQPKSWNTQGLPVDQTEDEDLLDDADEKRPTATPARTNKG